MTSPAEVAVLLCTYDGASHLDEQLASIKNQQLEGLRIIVSDDGSSDGTVERLRHFAQAGCVAMHIKRGPGRGHAVNFLSLACDPDVEASYYAYADQDDIWDADKLARAVARLSSVPSAEPALYCSRTRSISEAGAPLGLSPLFRREPAFRNALVQNIGGGNTMVFNASARELLQQAGVVDVVTHDWWTYLLVSGAGGEVFYDPQPSLSYRQHGRNQIGANTSWSERLQRYVATLGGRNREWLDRNLRALQDNRHLLTPQNRDLLDAFCRARNGSVLERYRGVRQCGLYAQTSTGNLGLIAATLLKKI